MTFSSNKNHTLWKGSWQTPRASVKFEVDINVRIIINALKAETK